MEPERQGPCTNAYTHTRTHSFVVSHINHMKKRLTLKAEITLKRSKCEQLFISVVCVWVCACARANDRSAAGKNVQNIAIFYCRPFLSHKRRNKNNNNKKRNIPYSSIAKTRQANNKAQFVWLMRWWGERARRISVWRGCVWLDRWVMTRVRTYGLINNFSDVPQRPNKSWKAWHFQNRLSKTKPP